jgi:hypothetical protein
MMEGRQFGVFFRTLEDITRGRHSGASTARADMGGRAGRVKETSLRTHNKVLRLVISAGEGPAQAPQSPVQQSHSARSKYAAGACCLYQKWVSTGLSAEQGADDLWLPSAASQVPCHQGSQWETHIWKLHHHQLSQWSLPGC